MLDNISASLSLIVLTVLGIAILLGSLNILAARCIRRSVRSPQAAIVLWAAYCLVVFNGTYVLGDFLWMQYFDLPNGGLSLGSGLVASFSAGAAELFTSISKDASAAQTKDKSTSRPII